MTGVVRVCCFMWRDGIEVMIACVPALALSGVSVAGGECMVRKGWAGAWLAAGLGWGLVGSCF